MVGREEPQTPQELARIPQETLAAGSKHFPFKYHLLGMPLLPGHRSRSVAGLCSCHVLKGGRTLLPWPTASSYTQWQMSFQTYSSCDSKHSHKDNVCVLIQEVL